MSLIQIAFSSILLFAAAFAASLIGTSVVLQALRDRAILDHPNPRSSHSTPTPRGGGIAVVAVTIIGWVALGVAAGGTSTILTLAAAAVGLAVLSWRDDLGHVSAAWRLAGQAAAVGLVLAVAPPETIFQGLLPQAADLAATGILWVWFINLFNFMDGIDGLAGVETVGIGLGLAVVVMSAAGGVDEIMALFGITAGGAALGFLRWNWPPAKIFLGDVGSVPLGFLLGWLILTLAASGQWAAALILPLYYITDATLTLFRRALRRQPLWKAHRDHFYQLAVKRGLSHGAVTGAVLAGNLGLVGLAGLAASGNPVLALGGAFLVVAVLMLHLGGTLQTRASARRP